MKKLLTKIAILILCVIATVFGCLALSACSKNGNNQNKAFVESQYGKWDEYDGVKIAFMDEDTYKNGVIDESKVLPELDCKLKEKYYMVVEFDIQAPYDNGGRESVTALVKVQPASIVSVTIQETNSGNVIEETVDNITELKATYGIPESAETVRNMRLVVQFIAKDRGLANVNLLFESSGGMQAVKTENVEKFAVMGYTEELEYDVFNNGYMVTGVRDTTVNYIVIPNFHFDGYVCAISEEAFKEMQIVETVIISSRVLNIGNNAFKCCERLERIVVDVNNTNYASQDGILYNKGETEFVHIPKAIKGTINIPLGVKDIRGDYFDGRDALERIVVEERNANYASQDGILYNKDKTEFVHIPKAIKGTINIPLGVKDIRGDYFDGRDALERIVVEERNANYASQDGILYNKDKTKFVHIPKAIKGVVSIPYNIRSISDNTFNGCIGLDNIILPDGITYIGSNAFKNCSGINNITIPDSVTSIGDDAFEGCTIEIATIPSVACAYVKNNNLKTVTITSGEAIDNGALSNCVQLSNVTISDSVTSIGNSAFEGCPIEIATIPTIACSYVKNTNLKTVIITSGENITSNALTNCDQLKNIMISNSVKSIDKRAFEGCVLLENILVDENSANYASCDGILYNKSKNKFVYIPLSIKGKIKIPDNITYINYEAFLDRNRLESILLSEKLITIDGNAFKGCSALTSVIIPDSVTSIGNSAFDGCPIEIATIPAIACGYVKNNNLKTVIITSGNSIGKFAFGGCYSLTDITIPHSVTTIENQAFDGCRGLTKIELPNSVISIGSNAFLNCGELTSVKMSDCLINIGNYAFMGCSKLEIIDIPNGLTNIGEGTFENCVALKNIIIPSSVISIGVTAFKSCKNLEKITVNEDNPNYLSQDGILYNKIKMQLLHIPQSVKGEVEILNGINEIKVEAFRGCSGLTNITIPNSVTSIGSEAFRGCSGLTNITIPNGVTRIGEYTFQGCSGLTSITIPDDVTSIGHDAFRDCNRLTSITIPDSVTSVGDNAFYGCPIEIATIPAVACSRIKNNYLKTVSITSGDSIGDSAFIGCAQLKSITIPDSVTSVGDNAFYGCPIEIATIPAVACSLVNNSNLKTVVITSGDEIGDNAFNGCDVLESIIMPTSITRIGNYAFNGCSGLTSIMIPNSVTSIGEGAFDGCSGLTDITIPERVTNIGKRAFLHCSGLISVIIPDGITSIEENLFAWCSELTSVTIPDSVTCISYFAFKNCSKLTSVKLSDNLYSIKEEAFLGCSALKSIIIPDSVMSISYNVFKNCSKLTSVKLSDNLNIIEGGMFSGCSALTNVVIPDGVTNIEWNAFENCSKLTSIKLSNNLVSIGGEVFSGCSALTSVIIPDSVKSIGKNAFDGCPIESATIPAIACSYIKNNSLKSVVITSGESISSIAFYGCNSLITITIPDSITTIGGSAFQGCNGLTSIIISSNTNLIEGFAFAGCEGLNNITYKGTKELWNAITKGYYWDFNTGDYTVQCTDGKLDKSGKEI